jgi:hypothetical protein
MQLDVYVPFYGVAFEYQGEYHYHTHFKTGNNVRVKTRDLEKDRACKDYGITLIHIPYWWKKDRESLVEIIHATRPDLVESIKKW